MAEGIDDRTDAQVAGDSSQPELTPDSPGPVSDPRESPDEELPQNNQHDSEEGDGEVKDHETGTDDTADSEDKRVGDTSFPIVSSTKKSRPPYKYDPDKITLRFLFANRDGLTVTIQCKPSDTVGDVKGALLSVWPKDLQDCSGGDRLRLVCMGKGYLMPDTRSLEDCQIPVFKTHPTPVNVSVRPEQRAPEEVKKKGAETSVGSGGGRSAIVTSPAVQTSQGCACVIL